jgi:hypothetical protein
VKKNVNKHKHKIVQTSRSRTLKPKPRTNQQISYTKSRKAKDRKIKRKPEACGNLLGPLLGECQVVYGWRDVVNCRMEAAHGLNQATEMRRSWWAYENQLTATLGPHSRACCWWCHCRTSITLRRNLQKLWEVLISPLSMVFVCFFFFFFLQALFNSKCPSVKPNSEFWICKIVNFVSLPALYQWFQTKPSSQLFLILREIKSL